MRLAGGCSKQGRVFPLLVEKIFLFATENNKFGNFPCSVPLHYFKQFASDTSRQYKEILQNPFYGDVNFRNFDHALTTKFTTLIQLKNVTSLKTERCSSTVKS
jgi:hypothetical protein